MSCHETDVQSDALQVLDGHPADALSHRSAGGFGRDLLDVLFDNFPGGIALIDASHRVAMCNTQLKLMMDYPDALFSRPPGPTLEELFWFNAQRGEYGAGDGLEQVSQRLALVRKRQAHIYERMRPNGTVLEIRGTPIDGGGFVTTYFDVTKRHRASALIAHMAHHDGLTDLPNRSLLLSRLERAIEHSNAEHQVAVHYLDLDNFKIVNDSYGHRAGDNLLIAVAQRLRSSVRATDLIGRLGGDEFAIVQSGIFRRVEAMALANRVVDALARPFVMDDCTVGSGVSIGIALSPWSGSSADELLHRADEALYASKRLGKGRYSFAA